MSLVIALISPTKTLLRDISDSWLTQKSIALTYSLALRTPDMVDWPAVNQAIIERWSESGLKRIKRMAWKMHDQYRAEVTL